MLTLPAALQSRYDGTIPDLKPRVKLSSYSPVASIPFPGNHISAALNETEPHILVLSDDRVFATYIAGGKPYITYSDTNRTFWTHNQPIVYDTNFTVTSIACCEMPDGNIAIIYALNQISGTYQAIVSKIYSPQGVLVSNGNSNIHNKAQESDFGITLAYDGTKYRYIFATHNGSYYCFWTASSLDMITWTAYTTLTVPGLSTAYALRNPSLVYPTGHNPLLIFDYIESYDASGSPLINLYTCETLDDFLTLESPVKRTFNSTIGNIATQPYIVESGTDELMLVHVEETPTLYMSHYVSGWGSPVMYYYQSASMVEMLVWDPARRKFYVMEHGTFAFSQLGPLTEIDLDSWEPSDSWSNTTVPYLQPGGQTGSYANDNTKVYNGLIAFKNGGMDVAILNPEANTLKYWKFADNSSRNVNWRIQDVWIIPHAFGLSGVCMGDDGWVYTFHTIGYTHDRRQLINRIHIEDAGPTYTVQEMWFPSPYGVYGLYNNLSKIRMFDSENVMMILGSNHFTPLLLTGGIFVLRPKVYWVYDGSYNVPNTTPVDCYIEGLYIYVIFSGQDGIWKFDTDAEYATRIQTVWPINSPQRMEYDPTLRALMVTSNGSGLHVYYLDEDRWDTYNSSTVQGITPNNQTLFSTVFYDEINDGFVVGTISYLDGVGGAVVFIPRQGKINQIQYTPLTYSTQWDMGTTNKLVEDFSAQQPTIAYVPGTNEFYAMWEDLDPGAGTSTLSWDNNESDADLTAYILDDSDMIWSRNVLKDACTLEFSLAPGTLFDVWNLTSMVAKYVQKGRKLILQAGEEISGVDTLVGQGTYYVTSTKRTYKKPQLPVTKVRAHNKIDQIKEIDVNVSEYLANYTGAKMFKDIAVRWGAVPLETDIDSVPFIGDKLMSTQFVDMDLFECLDTLAWRFGTVIRYDMNDKLDCVVMPNRTVNHTYNSNNPIFEFTPNDEYSDLTNNVIVHGVLKDLTKILYPEELVGQVSGSVGWWGEPETYTVWFSQDKERVVENIRMEVISSAEAISFKLAGGVTERISYEDPEGKYCKVKVDAPNLIPALVAAIGTYVIASEVTPDLVEGVGVGVTTPLGRRIEGIALFIAFQILGSIATFQYEIYGQPVGYVERAVQNPDLSASDAEHIAYMGQVFTKHIEGWECNSINECLVYAKRELEIVKMQRRRVQFEKVAHLQDEEGDTISVQHPDTLQPLETQIIKLERKFKKGKKGYIKDKIEGWVL